MATGSTTGVRYVVTRLNWQRHWDGTRFDRRPGGHVVASFPTREAADADAARREAEARRKVNPFTCGGAAAHHWTHLDEPRLRDWLLDHGVTPPDPMKDGRTDWAKWWARKKGPGVLSARDRAVVWEALDKVRFYRVEERPVRPVVYALVALNWEYNDENYYVGGEKAVTAFRSREKAEAECARRNAAARREWAGGRPITDNLGDFEIEPPDADPFDPPGRGEVNYLGLADAPFFEVVEVELEGA